MRQYASILILSMGVLCSASPAEAQLRGHGGPVRAVAISPDGARMVSGSFDTTIILWSLPTSLAEQVLRFHEGAVNAVVFLKDGRIATSGEDASIAIWQLGQSKPVRVLKGHTAPVVALAVSPDGNTLASAAWDHTARLWSLGTAHRVRLRATPSRSMASLSPQMAQGRDSGLRSDARLCRLPVARLRSHPAFAVERRGGRAETAGLSQRAPQARFSSFRQRENWKARSRSDPRLCLRLPLPRTAP